MGEVRTDAGLYALKLTMWGWLITLMGSCCVGFY